MATKAPYTSSPIPTTTLATSAVANTTANGSITPPPWTVKLDSFWSSVLLSVQITSSLEAIFILGANFLLLFVIVSSALLRSRMRNQLVVSVVVANLLVGVLGAPFAVDYALREEWVHDCYITVILVVLCAFVQNFISTWGVVALLLHYVARLLRYEGPGWLERLPLWLQRALPALLTASPWIVSVVLLIPMIFGGLHRDVLTVWSYNTCPFVLEQWSKYSLNILSFFLPAVILIALIVLIIILSRRREEKTDSPSRMETGQEMMSDTAQELEACWVHVVVAVLTLLMMGPEHTLMLKVLRGPWKQLIVASLITRMLSDLLPFVVAMVWMLMLPDVRDRVREVVAKLPGYLTWCRTRSPPQAPGTTTVAPVAFKDLQDE